MKVLLSFIFLFSIGVSNALLTEYNKEEIKAHLMKESHRILGASIKNVQSQETIKVEDDTFRIGAFWTLFSLRPYSRYNISTWGVAVTCGARPQKCHQCECFLDPNKSSWLWWTRITGNNYCWNISQEGNREYTMYNFETPLTYAKIEAFSSSLTMTATLPHSPFQTHISYVNSQSSQAFIENLIYVEDSKRIITKSSIDQLNKRPKIIPDIAASKCQFNWTGWSTDLKYSQIEQLPEKANIFRHYVVLHKPPSNFNLIIHSLEGLEVLTSEGLVKFNLKSTSSPSSFELFDICNKKFLTMKTDEYHQYYVVSNELVDNPILCIAIRLRGNNIPTNQLVLYEARNFTSQWTWSTRFQGIVSSNYVNSIDLEIRKIESQTDALIKETNVQISSSIIDQNNLDIQLSTELPVNCEILISQSCQPIIISTSALNGFKVHRRVPFSECKELEKAQIGSYNCSGIIGTFNIGKNLEFSSNISSVENIIERNYNLSPSLSEVKHSWLYILILFPYGIVLLILTPMFACIYKIKKRQFLSRKPYEHKKAQEPKKVYQGFIEDEKEEDDE